MAVEKGSVSVQMENLFPLIKKWLYSEKDIFVRELVTNSLDAISKLRHLAVCGEFKEDPDEKYEIHVRIDRDAKTIVFSDNGIGMTADEIRKYISEVAFSGASDFMDKYRQGGEGAQIIGHFGLGFYSSFIISDSVEIDSLSYVEGSAPAHWRCAGAPDYEMSEGVRTKRGTDVVLHVSDSESDYLDEFRLRNALETYCSFMPVPIFLNGSRINESKALWNERPADVKEDEYRKFYRLLYPFEEDPIFWIHINVEFPVRAKGILYFPKLSDRIDQSRFRIKFYYNSVYVSDNLKDLIPPFLANLRGVIDCPDMPLNVSRSYLQQDPVMKKLTAYITRKVSDELTSLFKSDREKYEKCWDDVGFFVKIGMMEDEKFFEAMKGALIFRKTSGGTAVFDELCASKPGKIYYASSEKAQSFYVELLEKQGRDVIVCDSMIDPQFLMFLEGKYKDVKLVRVDAELSDESLDKSGESGIVNPVTNKTASETVEQLFRDVLSIPGLEVRAEYLKTSDVPAVVILKEDERRLKEIYSMYKMEPVETPSSHTLVVNMASPVVKSLLKGVSGLGASNEDVRLVVWQVYDLALIPQRPLFALRLEAYAKDSSRLLERYASKFFGE